MGGPLTRRRLMQGVAAGAALAACPRPLVAQPADAARSARAAAAAAFLATLSLGLIVTLPFTACVLIEAYADIFGVEGRGPASGHRGGGPAGDGGGEPAGAGGGNPAVAGGTSPLPSGMAAP